MIRKTAIRKRKHKDVEFLVEDASGKQRVFETFDEAAGFAAVLSISTGKRWFVDVLIYSDKGAFWYGLQGDWDEGGWDEEASVSDRIEIFAESLGKVP